MIDMSGVPERRDLRAAVIELCEERLCHLLPGTEIRDGLGRTIDLRQPE